MSSTFLHLRSGIRAHAGHPSVAGGGEASSAAMLVPETFGAEAREVFDDVVVAHDLDRVPVPARR